MIKATLKNSFQIVRESLPLLLIWLVYHLISNLLTLFLTPIPTLPGEESGFLSIPLIVATGFCLVFYYYLYAGTLAYARDKINLKPAITL